MLNIENYKVALTRLSSNDDRRVFIQKNFLHGLPKVFEGREDDYFNFRKRIADNFDIEFLDVFVVGSSKFGFSPYKLTDFCETSDIDVLIVNEVLFEKFSIRLCDYEYLVSKGTIKLTNAQLNKYLKFVKYFITGWMRPDLLPQDVDDFKKMKNDWDDFFKKMSFNKSEVGNYKVTGGLFKNYYYAEKYYFVTIDQIAKKHNDEKK